MRLFLFVLAASLSITACTDAGEQVDPAPDATPELADPDPDTPLDVDPLSRQDGQSSDEAAMDSVETGDDLFNSPVEDAEGTM